MSSASHWITTSDGRDHFVHGLNTVSNEHDIRTIAHSLAQINRFTGHARRPYSVAEHSLLCADIAERMQLPVSLQYACLLHDAHEAYTGDLSSPVKYAVDNGGTWTVFELAHATSVRKWFGVSSVFAAHRARIHHIDMMALATERRDLVDWQRDRNLPWPVIDVPGVAVPVADWVSLTSPKRENTHWTEWAAAFLERFHALRRGTQAQTIERLAAEGGAA